MVPTAEPETSAARTTLFKGAVPEEGLAVKETERVGDPTFTVTLSEAEPPGPVQVKVYVFELVRLPVDSEPEVAFEPDQPL